MAAASHCPPIRHSTSFLGQYPEIIMSRVYVGRLQPHISERQLENVFQVFGVLRSVWVSQRPFGRGYAFVEFDERRDALNAIAELDGKNGWRVELYHNSEGGRGYRASTVEIGCYNCDERGLSARGFRRHNRSSSPQHFQGLSYRCRSYSPPRRSHYDPGSGSPSGSNDSTYRWSYRGQRCNYSNGRRNQN